MPCVSPNGNPTASGTSMLNAIKNGATTPEEIASKTGQPLFKVRSGLRELTNSGFLESAQDKYTLSAKGNTVTQ